jgi:ribonucleoside-diphosphate reductase alpha chain
MVKLGEYQTTEIALRNLPDFFVTSDQIDWRFRVDMQGVWSHAIDHSVSSTINLPKGTSEAVVGEIYLRAWKSGLKGITVYVDGSKDGVLLSKEDTRPIKVQRQEAPKRPAELPCEIHRLSYKGKHWLAAVGLLGSEPYEMFACEDLGDVSKNIDRGVLVKKSRGRYALLTEEGSLHNIAVPEFGWATRLISTSLRHGVPIDYLVEQLNKEGNISDLNKVLARVLKKYIRNGKVRTSVVCPACSSTNLVWQGGCMGCVDCGHEKCG